MVAACLVGLMTGVGVVPFLFRKTIPRRVYDAVLGMGAGLMLSAATLGLLAEALHDVRADGQFDAGVLIQVLVGFAAGAVVLVLMERIPHQHAGGHREHISRHHDVQDSIHPHEHEHHEEGAQGHAHHRRDDHPPHPRGLRHRRRLRRRAGADAGLGAGGGGRLPERLRGGGDGGARCATPAGRASASLPPSPPPAWRPRCRVFGYLAGTHLTALSCRFRWRLASGALIYLISNEIIPETHSHGNEGWRRWDRVRLRGHHRGELARPRALERGGHRHLLVGLRIDQRGGDGPMDLPDHRAVLRGRSRRAQ
jgi:ZIP family zinc transporter